MAECTKVDECKDWADRMEAMASYARQAADEDLFKMARRIQGRAVKRCGELLKEYQSKGGRPPSKNGKGGETGTPRGTGSQKQAAKSAGMSKKQEVRARRVAVIPDDQFEEMIESDDPPSVTALAEAGKKALTSPKPEGFKEATSFIGALRELDEFCNDHRPELIASGLRDREKIVAVGRIRDVTSWLGDLVSIMEE